MQNSDNTLNLKQALLELLKVVKKNHYTKDENDFDGLNIKYNPPSINNTLPTIFNILSFIFVFSLLLI